MKKIMKVIVGVGLLAGVTTGSLLIGVGVAALLVVLVLVLVYFVWRRIRRRMQHARS